MRVRVLDANKRLITENEWPCFAPLGYGGNYYNLDIASFIQYIPRTRATEWQFNFFKTFLPFANMVGDMSVEDFHKNGLTFDLSKQSGLEIFFLGGLGRHLDEQQWILKLVEEWEKKYPFLSLWQSYYLVHTISGHAHVALGHIGHTSFDVTEPKRILENVTQDGFCTRLISMNPPWRQARRYTSPFGRGVAESLETAIGTPLVEGLPNNWWRMDNTLQLMPLFFPTTWETLTKGYLKSDHESNLPEIRGPETVCSAVQEGGVAVSGAVG